MSRLAVSDSFQALAWQLLIELCSFVLRPLAHTRLSPGLVATMASADFRWPLSLRISPGQYRPYRFAPSGSTVTVDDYWALLILACSPAALGLTASSCSYGRRFASALSELPCGLAPGFSFGCRHLPRRGPFTPKGSAPAGHTSAPVLRRFLTSTAYPRQKTLATLLALPRREREL